MLTMRNGLSLHPGYSLGSLQSMLAPSAGLDLDEGNPHPLLHSNRGTETLSRDQDIFMQSSLGPMNHGPTTLPVLMPSTPNTTNSEMLPSYAPPMQNRFGLLNHLASTKVTVFVFKSVVAHHYLRLTTLVAPSSAGYMQGWYIVSAAARYKLLREQLVARGVFIVIKKAK